MGKGSMRRRCQVSPDEYGKNWDRIFATSKWYSIVKTLLESVARVPDWGEPRQDINYKGALNMCLGLYQKDHDVLEEIEKQVGNDFSENKVIAIFAEDLMNYVQDCLDAEERQASLLERREARRVEESKSSFFVQRDTLVKG